MALAIELIDNSRSWPRHVWTRVIQLRRGDSQNGTTRQHIRRQCSVQRVRPFGTPQRELIRLRGGVGEEKFQGRWRCTCKVILCAGSNVNHRMWSEFRDKAVHRNYHLSPRYAHRRSCHFWAISARNKG